MNQTLHIFKKDTRRFWFEIAVSCGALAIYVVNYPMQWTGWTPVAHAGAGGISMMSVVAAAWWLLIGRVIHAESLVGESQFWLTRPYEWKSLLAAKSLFIAVWVYVPFVFAQMLVLTKAGFSPVGHASDWVSMLVLYSGIFIAPLVALAAVTANFARMTLAVFGSYLAAIGCYTWIMNHSDGRPVNLYSQGYGTMVPYAHYFLLVVLVLMGGIAVVLLQYATRREWASRGLALGVAILVATIGLALSRRLQSEVERQYPTAGASVSSAVQLAFAPSKTNAMWVGLNQYEARVQFPINLAGIAEGTAVEVDDFQFSIDTSDGSLWTGPWRRLQTMPMPFLPGTHAPSLPFILSRKDYERFKSAPVTLHVTLAMTELNAGTETTATIASPTFAVPGFGVCSSELEGEATDTMICRSEFGNLPLAYVTAAFSDSPCSGPHPPANDVRSFAEFMGEVYSNPVNSVSEIVRLTYAESAAYDSTGRAHGTHGLALCPGTTAHFRHYDAVRRSRAYLTVPNFQLPQPKEWRQK